MTELIVFPVKTDADASIVAAWYASPGTDGIRFAEYSQNIAAGKDYYVPDGLLDDIEREIRETDKTSKSYKKDLYYLYELFAFIIAGRDYSYIPPEDVY
jgi:hypothetical protein